VLGVRGAVGTEEEFFAAAGGGFDQQQTSKLAQVGMDKASSPTE